MSVVRTYLFSAPYAYIAERSRVALHSTSMRNSFDIDMPLAGLISEPAVVVSGEMLTPDVYIDAYEREGIESSSVAVLDGTMIVPLVTYDAFGREVIESSARSVGDGNMIAPLVTYDAYSRDGIVSHARSVMSGTMTTS